MTDDADLAAILAAQKVADAWYERAVKHPMKIEDGWRWVLPEPGKEDLTNDLPREVFDRLKSDQKFPWVFDSRVVAVLMAELAACRAVLAGWVPEGKG